MPEDNVKQVLPGAVVLVTGAAAGIGFACAERAAMEGATVVLADIAAERVAARAAELVDRGFEASPAKLDVTDEQAWNELVESIIERHGRLDVLVNNAGICLPGSLESLSFEDFQRMSAVNVDGTLLGTRAAILAMRRCAGEGPASGAVVNISSVAGQTAIAGVGGYCASKAAITNMTRALAVECAEKGEFIRINSVHPGTVRTELSEGLYGTAYFDDPANFERFPARDYARPEDIAGAVVYLASERARMVTGSDLVVDGGFTAGIAGGI